MLPPKSWNPEFRSRDSGRALFAFIEMTAGTICGAERSRLVLFNECHLQTDGAFLACAGAISHFKEL